MSTPDRRRLPTNGVPSIPERGGGENLDPTDGPGVDPWTLGPVANWSAVPPHTWLRRRQLSRPSSLIVLQVPPRNSTFWSPMQLIQHLMQRLITVLG